MEELEYTRNLVILRKLLQWILLTVLLLSFPHSVCIGMRFNFLALVTKLSVPATAVINQLSWHTIKKLF